MAKRKVTLVLVDHYGAARVAKTKSKADGRWKLKGEFTPGIYFAKAKKANVDGVKCKAGESANETLES